MRWILVGAGALLGLVVAYGLAHLALIEVGKEVVVLHKPTAEGETRRTRLWIVDEGEHAFLHHGHAGSPWIRRLGAEPVVTLERGGETRRYRAAPAPEADERVHRLMRAKYGFADWWVRLLTEGAKACTALPVRLDPLPEGVGRSARERR